MTCSGGIAFLTEAKIMASVFCSADTAQYEDDRRHRLPE
ncbi:hypothetical protein QFZ97_005605 [Paraburkholderia youngii]